MPDDTDSRTADRVQIRDLVDAYAHHADRREPALQAAVFTEDSTVTLYPGDPSSTAPTQELHGRQQLADVFAQLTAAYETTTYLNGQSTVTFTCADDATGETYCLAMHLLHDNGTRTLLTMFIRYLDQFTRTNGHWLIAHRALVFDWTDRRPSTP